MDLTSLSAIFGALAGAAATAWTISQGRGPLRRLERVSAVLKDMPDDAAARPALLLIQQDLAKRINTTYRAPRLTGHQALAWVGRVSGAILVGVAYISFVSAAVVAGTKSVAFWSADGFAAGASYFGIGIGLFLGAEVLLHVRQRTRRAWITAHPDEDVFDPYL